MHPIAQLSGSCTNFFDKKHQITYFESEIEYPYTYTYLQKNRDLLQL